jgi:hypothetical protein
LHCSVDIWVGVLCHLLKLAVPSSMPFYYISCFIINSRMNITVSYFTFIRVYGTKLASKINIYGKPSIELRRPRNIWTLIADSQRSRTDTRLVQSTWFLMQTQLPSYSTYVLDFYVDH